MKCKLHIRKLFGRVFSALKRGEPVALAEMRIYFREGRLSFPAWQILYGKEVLPYKQVFQPSIAPLPWQIPDEYIAEIHWLIQGKLLWIERCRVLTECGGRIRLDLEVIELTSSQLAVVPHES